MASVFDLTQFLSFNPFARFFKQARKDDEDKFIEDIKNSQGVSQEEIDNGKFRDFSALMTPASNVSYIGVMFEQYFGTKVGRISKYREMSLYPRISNALDMVCDEAIVNDNKGNILSLEILKEMPDHITEEVRKIWGYLVNDVFSFNERGWEFFKKWLVEAELYIELVLNKEGNDIVDIKILPAHTIMPIYDENKIKGYIQSKVPLPISTQVIDQNQVNITFDRDQIAYVNYGLYGQNLMDIRGYLEPAIRVYNQLKNLEDALVIYRLVRAPSRRVWNIYTGRMPKGKAEEYIKGMIQRYKKKIIYDPETGAMNSAQNIQSLTEDFWFSKGEDGQGTSVETIEGSMQMGEMNDIKYFLEQLGDSLKFPRSRLETATEASNYSIAKPTEVMREEMRFSRFIERLQRRFKYIVLNPFMTLLRLRGIDERYISESNFCIRFNKGNLFEEYKQMELLESKFALLSNINDYIYSKDNPKGFFAAEYVLRDLINLSDEQWNKNKALLDAQKLADASTGESEAGTEGGGLGQEELPSETGGEELGGGGAETTTPEVATPEGGEETPTAEPVTAPESFNYTKANGKDTGILKEWKIDMNGKKIYRIINDFSK